MKTTRCTTWALALGLLACGPSGDEAADDPATDPLTVTAPGDGRPAVRALPELDLPAVAAPAPVRRVLPLLPDPVDSLPPALLDETFEPAHVLAPGALLSRPLDVVRGQPYLIEVEFAGAAPRVRSGPADDTARTAARPLPLPPRADVLQATIRTEAADTVLELVGPAAGSRLARLSVRPWGRTAVLEQAGGDRQVVRRLDVVEDHRPGLVLAAGHLVPLQVALPEHATRLSLAVAHDPDIDMLEPTPAGLALVVRARDAVYDEVLLEERVELPETRAVWRSARLDVAELAGRALTFEFEAALSDPPDDLDPGALPALALAVPEVLCERGERRPNLVLVSLDTTRKDHFGSYGYARETTPRLDALAARGVLFEHATSTSSWTLPSHTTMLSGTWAETHGVEHPAQAIDVSSTPWLAALLREAGWATRAFTGGGYLNADYGFAHGFAAFSDYDPVFDANDGVVRRLASTPVGERLLAARNNQTFDVALQWVETHAELPFFLFLQTFAVHDYRPTGEFLERFRGDREGPLVERLRSLEEQLERPYTDDEQAELVDLYDGALAQVDAMLGRLFDQLEASGLAEHTYVVITADHGEVLGEHGLYGKPVVGHAFGVWDELLAVPLIIAGPGLEPRRVPERVSLVDLVPTLLELLERPIPDAVQGRSLVPLLRGRAQGFVPSPAIAGVHSHVTWVHALHQGAYKVVVADPDALVGHPQDEPLQLFDLRDDPGETTSLHESRRDRAADLQGALRALRADLRARRTGEGRAVEMDAETLRQLQELGYVDG